ncbi:hypothetical protein ELI_3841 [Eubacterium callanderi]|uniref:Uncharacterized protein n=1 Tax=Eubacterium callanderi TaxID=53442 RepID=E3GGI3_9FIRM|nr:hypothetical protein ELI_3841 [Eubacterium callanderi]
MIFCDNEELPNKIIDILATKFLDLQKRFLVLKLYTFVRIIV